MEDLTLEEQKELNISPEEYASMQARKKLQQDLYAKAFINKEEFNKAWHSLSFANQIADRKGEETVEVNSADLLTLMASLEMLLFVATTPPDEKI